MPGLRTKTKKRLILGGLVLFFCLFWTDAFALSVTASSYYTIHRPSRTIDKNLSTYWRGKPFQPFYWLKFDLGSPTALSKISIFWHKDYGSNSYTIQASNDNTTWVNLYTRLSTQGAQTNPIQKDYPLSGTYRYLRLLIYKAFRYSPIIYEVEIQAITPPVLSISVEPKSWNIGLTEVNKLITMEETNKIRVTNNGNAPETLELKLINPSGWSASTTPNQNKYVLSALFCNYADSPQDFHFNQDAVNEDAITEEFKKATNSVFAYTQGTANGVAVASGESRALYLQFKSPTITENLDEQNISVIVSCQTP